jgi:hypothetical protein
VCCIAAWGSQSHANLAHAGFRVAYAKAVWWLGPSGACSAEADPIPAPGRTGPRPARVRSPGCAGSC